MRSSVFDDEYAVLPDDQSVYEDFDELNHTIGGQNCGVSDAPDDHQVITSVTTGNTTSWHSAKR